MDKLDFHCKSIGGTVGMRPARQAMAMVRGIESACEVPKGGVQRYQTSRIEEDTISILLIDTSGQSAHIMD
jgi:hypothetical protein